MSTGYTRQSSAQITSGQEITSSCFNNEFNQLQSAFSAASGHAHDGTTGGGGPLSTAALDGLSGASVGLLSVNGVSGFTAFTLAGTASQISIAHADGSTGTPTISIDTGYVGQASITTLGTIGTGVWAGTAVGSTHGGTGVNNTGTLTYGSSNVVFTTSGATNVTLPTSGTLLSSSNNLSDVSSSTTAANNILPSQSGKAGDYLKTDGSGTLSWSAVSGASGGTVTSVTFTGDGVVLSNTASTAVTASGTLTAALANAAAGAVLNNATTSSAAPTYTTNAVLGNPGTTAGSLSIANGSASGVNVKIQNLGTTTTGWNFNLPQTAGTSGTVLTSGGGGAGNMSWTTLSGTSGISYSSGAITLAAITANSIYGNNTGSSAVPSALTMSQVLSIVGGTKGQVLYCSATNTWSALSIGTSTQVLTVASGLPAWADASIGVSKVSAQTFTSGGTYTPTSGTKFAIVEMVGGGGGGAGNTAASFASAGGGGSGGYLKALLTSAQISTSQTVTIGAAGGGGATGVNGGAGGTTSLGSLLSCGGGGAGTYNASSTGAAGGAGGSATVTTGTSMHVLAGQVGGFGCNVTTGIGGGGGSNPLGFGAALNTAGNGSSNGAAATGFGGGGSGASCGSSGGAVAGGAGTAGAIIITEYQ